MYANNYNIMENITSRWNVKCSGYSKIFVLCILRKNLNFLVIFTVLCTVYTRVCAKLFWWFFIKNSMSTLKIGIFRYPAHPNIYLINFSIYRSVIIYLLNYLVYTFYGGCFLLNHTEYIYCNLIIDCIWLSYNIPLTI